MPVHTRKILFFSLLVGIGIFVVISLFFPRVLSNNGSSPPDFVSDQEVVNDVSLALEAEGAKLPLSELQQGCPVKDCIPAINDPIFESVSQADDWLEDEDRVFVLTFNDQTKIYPQRIMNWHEIVNDWYGSEDEENLTAIGVTFCPLCGTATAFERKVNDTITEFGVSGKLHNSDLVMYDRLEGSLWQQITGEAIVGPAARRDEVLEPLFLVTLWWRDAKTEFPEAEILSRETGYRRDYARYPYGRYEEDEEIYFGVGNQDERLHPKSWVYGIEIDEQSKAYPEEKVLAESEIIDFFAGSRIEIIHENGVVTFQNLSLGQEIVPLRAFWFAWSAFHPDTELY